MQLTIGQNFATYTPPKNQLLKWVGNKQKFAGEITRYFPKTFNSFYEPFLGSGAILATVSPTRAVGSDSFSPLIDIWQTLANDPESLVRWYAERRQRLERENKVEVYLDVRHSFNTNPNGADFLFLTRSCYGGIIRFRKTDGYMSTPCGVHNPMPVEKFSKTVKDWHKRMRQTEFLNIDYKDAFAMVGEGDLVYCDPPYSHSQSILYGAQSFILEDLFECIKQAKDRGAKIALSIDGHKKSGLYECDLPIPDGLFQKEVFISLGRSMLRRFQMEGQTLEKEMVSDRLLLTYNID